MQQLLILQRHTASPVAPTIVEQLVQNTETESLIHVLALDLFRWDHAHLSRLSALLASTTPRATLEQLIETERAINLRWMSTIISPESKAPAEEQESIRKLQPKLEAHYSTLLTTLSTLPPLQAAEKLDGMKDDPLISCSASHIAFMLRKMLALNVLSAQLRTAIDIRLHGPEAVGKSSDPSSGKPFTYEKAGDSFTLTSGFSYKNKPVSLTFQDRNID